jgi:DNA-binding transcriptional LysR family regulator
MACPDLDDLRLFAQVVEAGSITAGAARANLALAAASTRMRRMEESFGVRLLARSRQGVTPTSAGRALLVHARGLLEQVARMHDDLATYAGLLAGPVRLLANTNSLTEFLPEVLASFLSASPGVTIDLQERLSDEIVGLVAEGAAEIGVVAGTVDTHRLETFPFRADRFAVVVARTHLFAGRPSVAFNEALSENFVGLDRESALQRLLAKHAAREGRRIALRVQMRGFEAVCRMVEAGVGIGIVPQSAAERAARTMALVVVPLSDAWAKRDLVICMRSLAALPAPARRLAEHLAAHAD